MATRLANISIKDSSSWNTFLDLIYPVGCVYISYTSASPAVRFGGTWASIIGRFPYFNAGADTGGSNKHSHGLSSGYAYINSSGSQMLFRYKNVPAWDFTWCAGAQDEEYGEVKGKISSATTLGGTTDSASNLPSYQTLYAWRRTA